MNQGQKINAQQLWRQTMKFVWAKLLVRLVAILIGAIVLSITISLMLAQPQFSLFTMVFGFGLAIGVYAWVVRIFGYAIRVGHIAVLVETIKTGKTPDNQLEFGKDKVVSKFKTAAIFFVLDRAVDLAVNQLQNTVGNLMNMLPLPGLIKSFAKNVVKKALKFVDECCIGWIFYNEDQSATKGALDGVVIYFQNWKPILGNAVKTTLMMMVVQWILFVGLLIVFWSFTSVLGGGLWGWLAFFLGLMISMAIKRAFLDSWVMIRMMSTYFEHAPQTEIKFDIYGKLSGISSSFRKLADQAQDEINAMPRGTVSGQPAYNFDPVSGEALY